MMQRGCFVFSSYWGTWSRVLAEKFEEWQTVEVNLTPVNGISGDWNRSVRPIIIRKHCTTRDKNDKFANRLPAVWWKEIGDRLGGDLRHRLVTEDFLPLIDWEKYARVCNGGASLADILKQDAALSADSAARAG